MRAHTCTHTYHKHAHLHTCTSQHAHHTDTCTPDMYRQIFTLVEAHITCKRSDHVPSNHVPTCLFTLLTQLVLFAGPTGACILLHLLSVRSARHAGCSALLDDLDFIWVMDGWGPRSPHVHIQQVRVCTLTSAGVRAFEVMNMCPCVCVCFRS